MSDVKKIATVNETASAASPKASFMPRVMDFQLDKLSEKECEAQGLPSTSKSKARLGIEDDRIIIWPHANFTDSDARLLEAFCKSQDIATKDLLARVCMTWVEDNRAEMEKLADGFIRSAMSVEDIVKKAQAAKRQYEKMMALIGELAPVADDDNDGE